MKHHWRSVIPKAGDAAHHMLAPIAATPTCHASHRVVHDWRSNFEVSFCASCTIINCSGLIWLQTHLRCPSCLVECRWRFTEADGVQGATVEQALFAPEGLDALTVELANNPSRNVPGCLNVPRACIGMRRNTSHRAESAEATEHFYQLNTHRPFHDIQPNIHALKHGCISQSLPQELQVIVFVTSSFFVDLRTRS